MRRNSVSTSCHTSSAPCSGLESLSTAFTTLRPWIGAADPEQPRRARQFIVRRDPRDISVVYFYDPQAQQYLRVPYRDTSRPSLSIWELQKIRRRLQDEGRRSVDEQIIFEAWDRMRTLEQQAQRTTKTMRREQQRRRLHATQVVDEPGSPH